MHRCCLCPQHEDITDIHHIVPISEKGPDTEDNLMVVCPTCHAKIHRIRTMYNIEQLKMYKDRWVNLCAMGLTLEERLKKAPGISLSFKPSLHNQTSPEPNFVGRKEMLETITQWYKNPKVRIGALIGWGGVGKSGLVRKWYDNLESNNIKPDGIFWWGFYHNAYLEQFLNALLRYVTGGQIEADTIKSTWEKIDRIKEYISQGVYLIILDGLEQMQKSESGDEFGKMAHRECTELLHYLADVPKSEGLCLITTRFPLKDLDEWHERSYENLPLVDLSIPDAVAMLKRRGVKGIDDDMIEVINRYKGHALSLTSVAGYLNRYYDGDIKQAPDIEFVLGDKERFKDVNKLLRRYAEKMSEAERVFLKIFSLFRQEVTERDFVEVFRKRIEGTGLNDMIVKMSELDFKDLIGGLVDWRLISCDETKKLYTTHPLIKGYFESEFDQNKKKPCHKRIYEYFGEYAPPPPETLEQMQPLFEQVYHGCAAELYDEVYNEVYQKKIVRTSETNFLTKKLAAEETNLSLITNFFPSGDLSQLPRVIIKRSQSWLINDAGLSFLFTCRPAEAEGMFTRGLEIDINQKDWSNASSAYRNLCETQCRMGKIINAIENGRRAVKLAERINNEVDQVKSMGLLARSLFLFGKTKEAKNFFEKVAKLAIEVNPVGIHSREGIFYADFLTAFGRIEEAVQVSTRNLKIVTNKWPVDISRCHRCLGALDRIKGNYDESRAHLSNALEVARKIRTSFLEIEAMIEHGRLCLDMETYEDAIGNAEQILKICERTGFRFYEPEAEIVLAKAYLAENNFEKAETNAKSAYEKASGMKYRWAEGDAGHLLGEIYLAMGNRTKAREWMEKAVTCRKEILDPKVKDSETLLENLL